MGLFYIRVNVKALVTGITTFRDDSIGKALVTGITTFRDDSIGKINLSRVVRTSSQSLKVYSIFKILFDQYACRHVCVGVHCLTEYIYIYIYI